AVYLRAAGGHRLHHRAVRRGRLLRAQRWRRPDETVPVLPGRTSRGAVPILPAETGRRGRGRAHFAPRRRRVMIARLALVVGLVLGCAVAADAETTETYADYAMLGERTAGQFWAEDSTPHDQNGWRNQWTWTPQASGTESRVAWGDPAAWPPDGAERFIVSGGWVLLDGWSDNGTYYRQRVTSEWIGDGLD